MAPQGAIFFGSRSNLVNWRGSLLCRADAFLERLEQFLRLWGFFYVSLRLWHGLAPVAIEHLHGVERGAATILLFSL